MMGVDENYFRKTVSGFILIALAVLSFFLLKPVLMAIIVALILAFIFDPVHDLLVKKTKSKNISVSLIIVFLLIIILLPLWFLTPIIIDQSLKVFQATQQIDFVAPLQKVFPALFASEQFSNEIGLIVSTFTTKMANFLVNFFSSIILHFPTIFLQLVVVFFTFYFVLRDKKEVLGYVRSISPFSKEVEKKLFDSSKGITASVIYGQVIVGVMQGIIVGIGFLIFGVPNALFLTLLAILAGIFPVIGTTIVWLPVVIYFMVAGNNLQSIGILIFGLISSTVDNFLRPMIVSKRTDLSSAIVIIGMIGGLFMFGILGVILGPLILAYLIILLEVYRKKPFPKILIRK
jgi:predicted PurR-regulated permease PerM